MPDIAKPTKPIGIYLVMLFVILETAYSFTLFILQTEIYFYSINVVIDAIAIISVVGLCMMKKWGAALTVVLSGIYLGMNMSNLQGAYLHPFAFSVMESMQVVSISSIELVFSVIAAVYISKLIFANKFA